MSKVVRAVVGVVITAVGVVTGNFALVATGLSMVGGALLGPKVPRTDRTAVAAQLQLGEVPRAAIVGRAGIDGSLVDAFNYGGKYGTDWEVLVIALADHECDALEGFFVNESYHAFSADGAVSGFNGQLEVYWRSGTWGQTVPSILTSHGPGWTANDRGRSVAYVVVAYKADEPDAENPVWSGRRPQFKWVVRGLKCYSARLDTSVGGSGAHRRDNPATWEWTENLIDIRYNWVRGIYAGNLVDQPEMLLIGRGLSDIEAPPGNVFARANLCDEVVEGEPRYRAGGLIMASEAFIDVENAFAAACAGVIVQREGSVEIDPGEARSPVASFDDGNLIVGRSVRYSDIPGEQDQSWVNTVVARFVDPTQRWIKRAAPVKRDVAHITADRGPREQSLELDFVTSGKQAQRVAEINRRLGRLWGRGRVPLPPEFSEVEEGDWVTWTSERHLGGGSKVFRVEAWQSDEGWRPTLTLREIAASVYSDGAAASDTAVGVQQDPPSALEAPGVSAWTATAGALSGIGIRSPALIVTGATDDPAASFVRFEYVQSATVPGPSTEWTEAGTARPSVTRREIPVAANAQYYVAVSYVVDGIAGARRVLGPITTGAFLYADGTPVEDLQPAEPGATEGAKLGTNFKSPGDVIYTREAIETAEGIAAGFSGQTSWATYSAHDPANIAPRVAAGLNASGDVVRNLPASVKTQISLDQISDGSTNRFYTAGEKTKLTGVEIGANVTETRVAAGIDGQTAWATYTGSTGRVSNLSDSGNLASLANVTTRNLSQLNSRAWTNLFLANGITPVTDAAAVTAQGVAAGFVGQKDLATKSEVELDLQKGQTWQRVQFGAAEVRFNGSLAERHAGGTSWANRVLGPKLTNSGFVTFRLNNLAARPLAGFNKNLSATSGSGFNDMIAVNAINATTVLIQEYNGGTLTSASANIIVTGDEVWHMFWSGQTVRVYADGVLKHTFTGVTEADLAPMMAGLSVGASVQDMRCGPYDAKLEADIVKLAGIEPGADVTANAQRSIVPQFPVIEIKQGEAGNSGNRTVTHTAKRGTVTLTGGTWSLTSTNLSGGSASISSSTGTVTLSSIAASGAYTVRYTHTDGAVTELPVNVTYVPAPSAGVGSSASSITKSFSSTSLVPISNDLTIALPGGVTTATLLANNIVLEVPNALPAGTTQVQAQWQRETSPGTWSNVGTAVSASPHPGVIDEGGFPSSFAGLLTVNNTVTGLPAGSTQKFRLVARVSGGTTRTVTPFGSATVGG